jgi:hypothetical protein
MFLTSLEKFSVGNSVLLSVILQDIIDFYAKEENRQELA